MTKKKLMPIHSIQENAAKLVKMRQEIKNTFNEKERIKNSKKERMKSSKAELKWMEASHLFYSSYDVLAFPGGLTEGMTLLKNGDSKGIENALDFLEADPYFYGSGYIKEDILRYLSRMSLGKSQIERLQEILLARIKSCDRRREFKNYSNFAKKIANATLIEKINKIRVEADNDVTVWKAEIVLRKIGKTC